MDCDSESDTRRVPVTVLTGMLGAGKSTLLNHILSESHGKKFAVIENQFGSVGVDDAIIKSRSEEQIVETMNGCICCTIRRDLATTVSRLLEPKDDFDAIIVKTTGLADPGPVTQTFLVEPELSARCELDGIITFVDVKNIWRRLDDERCKQAKEQQAFADRIVLNKVDLVDRERELPRLEERISGINGMARILRTEHGRVNPQELIGIGGFSLDNLLEQRPDALTKEYGDGKDQSNTKERNESNESNHVHEVHNHGHRHEDDVVSKGFEFAGNLCLPDLKDWLADLIESKGDDLFRYKGLVAIMGMQERLVSRACTKCVSFTLERCGARRRRG